MALIVQPTSSSQQQPPRKWVIPEGVAFGDISRLELLPDDDPPAAEEEGGSKETRKVRVATRAVGLNFADIFTVLGYYSAANQVRQKPPTQQQSATNNTKNSKNNKLNAFCPGLEFAGVCQEDAPLAEFVKGDCVYGFTRFDAYADQVVVSPDNIRKLPRGWTFEQGASFLVNALTAWHGLVTVAGMPDHSKTNATTNQNPIVVVVHSAVGGVGLFASEIAARRGALVVGIAGSETKFSTFNKRILPLCPEAQCIVRNPDAKQFGKDLLAAIVKARSLRLENTGDNNNDSPLPSFESASDAVAESWGADYVMESYGGKYFQPTMDLINAGGSLATFGSTTYNGNTGGGGGGGNRIPLLPLIWQYINRPRIDPGELTSRNIRVGGFNLIFLTERTEQLASSLQQCIDCLEGSHGDGTLSFATPPVVGEVFDFKDAPDAMRALRSGQTVGKVVLSNKDNPLISS